MAEEYTNKGLLIGEIEWDNDIEKWTIYPDELDSIPTVDFISFSEKQVRDMWKGEWIKRHRHHGGFRIAKGVDKMGEQHEVMIDERCEYDDLYCSKCGKQSPDNFLHFCSYCGAPMTDEAVKMIIKKLEGLKQDG